MAEYRVTRRPYPERYINCRDEKDELIEGEET
jgi:hypothetical protein